MAGNDITRRGLLAGLGAAGGAALIGGASAQAAPAAPPTGGNAASPRRPDSTPTGIPTPLSSAPQPGVKYYFRDFEEFIPEDFSAGRGWGGSGLYTPSGFTSMTVSFDVPPGTVVYDIEWYVFNNSGSPQEVFLQVYSAGAGSFLTAVANGTTPSTGSPAAVRIVAPSSSNGPFPHGTRLVAGTFTSNVANYQINGVRLGVKNAPLSPVLLPSPVRIVDSRSSGGPLHNGSTRNVSLASHVPVGALGALLNLTAVNTVGTGYLATYATGTPQPATSSLNWYGSNQIVANQVTTAISGTRSITVFCHSQTNFIVDLLGYLV